MPIVWPSDTVVTAIVWPSSEPTWKVTLPVAFNILMLLNSESAPIRSISDASWFTSDWMAAWSAVESDPFLNWTASSRPPLEHGVDLHEGRLAHLHHRHRVEGVALGLGETAHLTAQVL